MRCPECEEQVPESRRFCPACGERVIDCQAQDSMPEDGFEKFAADSCGPDAAKSEAHERPRGVCACPECGDDVLRSQLIRCDICGEPRLCGRCVVLFNGVCRICRQKERCPVCLELHLPSHMRECEQCGRVICRECMPPGTRICPECHPQPEPEPEAAKRGFFVSVSRSVRAIESERLSIVAEHSLPHSVRAFAPSTIDGKDVLLAGWRLGLFRLHATEARSSAPMTSPGMPSNRSMAPTPRCAAPASTRSASSVGISGQRTATWACGDGRSVSRPEASAASPASRK